MCLLMVAITQWLGCLHLNSNLTGVTNQFVDLSFDPASKITTCFFLHQPKMANEKTCNIVYGLLGERCEKLSYQNCYSNGLYDKVHLGFPEPSNHLQLQKEYCFIATASNGTFTVSVEGSLLTAIGKINHCSYNRWPCMWCWLWGITEDNLIHLNFL